MTPVEYDDGQPMQHEIGNRTFFVADVEPLDVDGVRTVEVGTALWLVGFLALLPFYGRLEEAGNTGGCGPAWPGSASGCSGWSTAGAGASARPSAACAELELAQSRSISSEVSVSNTGTGSGSGSCFLASRTSEWAPQPWSNDTTRPSSLASPLAQTPNSSESGPAMRTRKPQVVQLSGAERASGASGPPSPSYHRCAASSRPSERSVRTRPRPRSWATVRICGLLVGVERVVAEEVRRDQPRVVVVDGQQVARRQVAGLDPLAVGHPRRGDDRLVAGDQHDLVDRDVFWRGWRGRR